MAGSGKSAEVDGIVARLSMEDPVRASEVRRELGLAANGTSGAMIETILARVRASGSLRDRAPSSARDRAPSSARDRASSSARDRPSGSARDRAPSHARERAPTGGLPTRGISLPAAVPRAATIARVIASGPSAARPDGDAVRFHLAVDDGGEYFVAGGAELILGHLRSHEASLPFLADVENRHVRFTCGDSFHGGTQWNLERLAAGDVRVNGETLHEAPRRLADGDEVFLARNLGLRFREPDASSGSALLELSSGAECQGVRRVVLLAPGQAGRVRIGSKRNRHIPVPDLAHEVSLEWSNGELRVSCAGGVRFSGGAVGTASVPSISIACPPSTATSFVLGARENAHPPFAIHVRPTEPPPSAGGPRA
jgi:hypothetical protein